MFGFVLSIIETILLYFYFNIIIIIVQLLFNTLFGLYFLLQLFSLNWLWYVQYILYQHFSESIYDLFYISSPKLSAVFGIIMLIIFAVPFSFFSIEGSTSLFSILIPTISFISLVNQAIDVESLNEVYIFNIISHRV